MSTQSTDPKPKPSATIRAGVVHHMTEQDEPHIETIRETIRLELLMKLTERGVPVDPEEIHEREWTTGGMHYVEATYEHVPISRAERDRLTRAYELGQMMGRYARRLIAGTAGAEFDRAQWAYELRTAQTNPWRGDLPASQWPDTDDVLVAFTLAYAWKRGYKNGEHAEEGSGVLAATPYGP